MEAKGKTKKNPSKMKIFIHFGRVKLCYIGLFRLMVCRKGGDMFPTL